MFDVALSAPLETTFAADVTVVLVAVAHCGETEGKTIGSAFGFRDLASRSKCSDIMVNSGLMPLLLPLLLLSVVLLLLLLLLLLPLISPRSPGTEDTPAAAAAAAAAVSAAGAVGI